jgi:nicotinamide phosphoribosyltransferase
MMTIENTDPACYWLTNYLETVAVQVWYPTTVATVSREMKRVILSSLKETGDPTGISFKLHDFGFRGVSSVESAGIGGLAHLINFAGTDTMAALMIAREHYDCKMAGYSIPAAEHSTITSWGRSREADACENMLTQYPEGLVAVVSDSYDIINACKDIWGDKLRQKVLSRKGTLVVRPDSGVPHEMVVKVLNTLGDYFEPTVNSKGFKVLPPQVRVIQGDGIDLPEMKRIARELKAAGWSMDNMAFGMGGALLQKMNRDTLKFAFKCSAIKIAGEWVDVYKRPASAPWKASKRGRLKLVQNPDGGFVTLRQDQPGKDCLEEVFRDGRCLTRYTLDDIRKRAAL